MTTKTVLEIRDRDRRRFGRLHEGSILKNTSALITPGAQIVITHRVDRGERYVRDETGRHVPNAVAYVVTRTFKIGDVATYGGMNLVYMGCIRRIAENTVTVVENDGDSYPKTHRMSLYDFAQKNWDFDAVAAAKRNSEWRD